MRGSLLRLSNLLRIYVHVPCSVAKCFQRTACFNFRNCTSLNIFLYVCQTCTLSGRMQRFQLRVSVSKTICTFRRIIPAIFAILVHLKRATFPNIPCSYLERDAYTFHFSNFHFFLKLYTRYDLVSRTASTELKR